MEPVLRKPVGSGPCTVFAAVAKGRLDGILHGLGFGIDLLLRGFNGGLRFSKYGLGRFKIGLGLDLGLFSGTFGGGLLVFKALTPPSPSLVASRSSTAALSERSRILAAQVETSSILSSVYTSALSARISAT